MRRRRNGRRNGRLGGRFRRRSLDGYFLTLRYLIALVDPDFDADAAKCCGRLSLAVVDVGAHCVEGHAAFHGALPARHLDAAQTAGDHCLAALSAAGHGTRNGLPERAPEGHAAFELVGNVARHEGRVQLRHADLLNVDANTLTCEGLEFAAKLIHFLAAAADDDAGLGCVDRYCDDVCVALDLDARDGGIGHCLLQVGPNLKVFLEQKAIVLVGEPLTLPVVDDADAEAGWMYFLAHVSPLVPRL